jgi:hypothetical protein
MTPDSRKSLLQFAVILALVLVCLVFRRVFYTFERAALEIRYFWWLFLILAAGLWLLTKLGRKDH